MKIGISSNALKNSGGLERYAMDLVRGLNKVGITPAFFTREMDPALVANARVDVERIPARLLPGKLRDHYFSWAIKRARETRPVDVLIGCNRIDSAEVAICGGTHLGFLQASGKKASQSDRWQIALEQRQYANAKMIVAHSERLRQELKELYGVESNRVRVLYPPVDRKRFQPVDAATRAQLRKQFGFGEHEAVLLFPSSSHKRKGLALIEQALRDSGLPVVLAVAGRAPGRSSPRVRYMGYVNNIEALYQAADLTVLASNYEPFGLVAVESVMCGTPVVMSSISGCCEVIDNTAMFAFESGDAPGLQRAIARAIEARRQPAQPAHTAHAAISHRQVLYKTDIGEHVQEMLALARSIHGVATSKLDSRVVADAVHHAL